MNQTEFKELFANPFDQLDK